MKIYTKTGDKGETSLIGGKRVSKDDIRIEAYGTVDELNSHVGMLRDLLEDDESTTGLLLDIQNELFTIGSHLATNPGYDKMSLPALGGESSIEILEQSMDKMNETLPEMRNFVLPGGHLAVSQAHVARCVCRRAERATIRLSRSSTVQDGIIRYLNRLSDYFFVLSRKVTNDKKAKEIPWLPKK